MSKNYWVLDNNEVVAFFSRYSKANEFMQEWTSNGKILFHDVAENKFYIYGHPDLEYKLKAFKK